MRSWFDDFWHNAFNESTLELKRFAEEEDSIPKRMSFREPDPFEDLRGTDAQVFAKKKILDSLMVLEARFNPPRGY